MNQRRRLSPYSLLVIAPNRSSLINLEDEILNNIIRCHKGNELENELSNISFSHYRCAAHVINLAVQQGLKAIGPEIKKLRHWVNKLKESPRLTDEMRKICMSKNISYLAPIIDVSTRWNSTYLMIQRQLKNKNLNDILVSNNQQTLKEIYPSENEWAQLHNLEQILQPMYEATQLLSSSKNPTIGDMRLKIDWELVLDEASMLSTVLDPRSKLTTFTIEQQNIIKQKLYSTFIAYQSTDDIKIDSSQQPLSRLYFRNILNKKLQYIPNDEISYYLNNPPEFNTNPLLWWNTHQLEYPTLSKIARDYLCIQATSVASEQEFSLAGLTISKTRTRLLPETARASLCLKDWIT
ncbi:12977_t:CDS:2, partial [Racocetra persica]